MMRTRIKICGITRPEDARAAARWGADAVGLVFFAQSPRAVAIEQAREIVTVLPPFVTAVGLFVNATRAWVEQVLATVPLGLLQFHGDEAPEDCRGYGRPYIKAVRMRADVDLVAELRRYHDGAGVLLDAYRPDLYGGTGQRFDWGRIPTDPPMPIVLAGGLNPDNVGAAVRTVHPYGVDVSGGVESAKGIKDEARIAAFIRGVRNAEQG